MTSNRFFIPGSSRTGDLVELEGREHHHLSRVSRVKAGDCVWLVDELGTGYYAAVEQVGARSTRLRILDRREGHPPGLRFILVQALLKPKAMDWLVQKAAEVGVAVIIPLKAERSVSRVGDNAGRKAQRWTSIAREAAKQCRSPYFTEVRPPSSLSEALREEEAEGRYFLSERGGRPWKDILSQGLSGKPVDPLLLCVGPEGGWTESEEEGLKAEGCQAVSLGGRILRAETAAVSAASSALLLWDR